MLIPRNCWNLGSISLISSLGVDSNQTKHRNKPPVTTIKSLKTNLSPLPSFYPSTLNTQTKTSHCEIKANNPFSYKWPRTTPLSLLSPLAGPIVNLKLHVNWQIHRTWGLVTMLPISTTTHRFWPLFTQLTPTAWVISQHSLTALNITCEPSMHWQLNFLDSDVLLLSPLFHVHHAAAKTSSGCSTRHCQTLNQVPDVFKT